MRVARTWLESTLHVTECAFLDVSAMGLIVATVAWAAGAFDRKTSR
jgi:hypothetical protein